MTATRALARPRAHPLHARGLPHVGGRRASRRPRPHGVLDRPAAPAARQAHRAGAPGRARRCWASRATPRWPTSRSRSTSSTSSAAPRPPASSPTRPSRSARKAVWFQLGVVDHDAFRADDGRRRADGHGHLPGDGVARPRLTSGGPSDPGRGGTRRRIEVKEVVMAVLTHPPAPHHRKARPSPAARRFGYLVAGAGQRAMLYLVNRLARLGRAAVPHPGHRAGARPG